jgi:hypothetical protein
MSSIKSGKNDSSRDDSAWFFKTLNSLLLDSTRLERDFPFLRVIFPKKVLRPKDFEIEVFNADQIIFFLTFFALLVLVLFVLLTSYSSFGTVPFFGSQIVENTIYRNVT